MQLLYSCCVKALLDRMGIGVQLLDDFVGLSDLDVRTALTQQLEANYREWKTLDDMDSVSPPPTHNQLANLESLQPLRSGRGEDRGMRRGGRAARRDGRASVGGRGEITGHAALPLGSME